jgi:hypothetical protein
MALAPEKNGSGFGVKKFKIVRADLRVCPGFGVWILTSEIPAPNTELMTPNFPTRFCRLNPGCLF